MTPSALVALALAAIGAGDYDRRLDEQHLDQPALDVEGYGETKALRRQQNGLRVTLEPGAKETGWKTPQQLRIGGDFTIKARLLVHKLPKPAQEDGVAVGIALGTQNIDQPEIALVRLTEPKGEAVYRAIERTGLNPGLTDPAQMRMMIQFGQAPAKPKKPPRRTFPAVEEAIAFELVREGSTLRYSVREGDAKEARYLGQMNLGPNDVAGVKLFACNRNGAEVVDATLVELSVHAHRLQGLGTVVRTVQGETIYGDPTDLAGDALVIGGPPKAPAGQGDADGVNPPAFPAGAAPGEVPRVNAFASATHTTGTGPAAPTVAQAPAAAVAATPPAGATTTPVTVVQAPAAVAVRLQGAVVIVRQGRAMARVVEGGQVVRAVPTAPASAPPATLGGPAPGSPKPKATIPLDQLESIRFERTPVVAGKLLGQPNVDVTGKHADAAPADAKDEKQAEPSKPAVSKTDDLTAPPPGTILPEKLAKVTPKKNGIRDLHLALTGLRDAAIKQVMITCQTEKGTTSWRLDTSDSRDWPLVLQQARGEGTADIYLEPPPDDCHQKNFMIQLMYEDGQNAQVNFQATEHSDAKLAFDPNAPPAPMFDVRVYLEGDEQLYGKLEGVGDDRLKLRVPWQDRLEIPLSRVAGVHVSQADRKETPESFSRRLKGRGAEDILLARTKEGEVVAIAGVLEGTDGDKLRFRYREQSRTLPLRLVEGLVLASQPKAGREPELLPLYRLSGGMAVSGRLKGLDAATWKVEALWGQVMNLPATEVHEVRFRGGEVVYLSDLEPSRVEESPYLGRLVPWRRNQNLRGQPLKVGGRTYEHGLAVHSRSDLTFDLDRRFVRFETVVGFDEESRRKGRVDCRILADGKEIWADPDLRADEDPVPLSLPVEGVEQLRLVVDFGPDQDTGDRVIWAGARLFRPASKPVAVFGGAGERGTASR